MNSEFDTAGATTLTFARKLKKTHIVRPGKYNLLQLLSVLILPILASCDRKSGTGSNTISRKEVTQLMQVDAESKDLVQRLEDHFHKEGYRFTLAYQSSGESSDHTEVSRLIRGPTLLICDGTEDEEAALRVDTEIRRFLGAEVMQHLDTQYEVKEGGYDIPGKLLRSRANNKGEQE
jgi:hypothetical protein